MDVDHGDLVVVSARHPLGVVFSFTYYVHTFLSLQLVPLSAAPRTRMYLPRLPLLECLSQPSLLLIQLSLL